MHSFKQPQKNFNYLYPACIKHTTHSLWQLDGICNLEAVSFQTSWVQEVPSPFLLLSLASTLLHVIRIGRDMGLVMPMVKYQDNPTLIILPYLQASFQSKSKHPDVQRGPAGTMLMKGETGPCQPFQWCSPSELHLKDLAGKHWKFNFGVS